MCRKINHLCRAKVVVMLAWKMGLAEEKKIPKTPNIFVQDRVYIEMIDLYKVHP